MITINPRLKAVKTVVMRSGVFSMEIPSYSRHTKRMVYIISNVCDMADFSFESQK